MKNRKSIKGRLHGGSPFCSSQLHQNHVWSLTQLFYKVCKSLLCPMHGFRHQACITNKARFVLSWSSQCSSFSLRRLPATYSKPWFSRVSLWPRIPSQNQTQCSAPPISWSWEEMQTVTVVSAESTPQMWVIGQSCIWRKCMGFGVRQEFKAQFWFLPQQCGHGKNYSTSLSLNFFICKMKRQYQ